MTDNYQKLVLNNLKKLYSPLPPDLATNLPGQQEGQRFTFTAFGEECVIEPQKITLGNEERSSIFGILISLYALHANPELCLAEPLKAFKEFPNSMPYIGAFTSHTELVLVPYVEKIKSNIHRIKATLNGQDAPQSAGGDFAFTLYPLPKIALSYIFYEADEDFPASVKCLYSNNAHRFMPMDGLADVGEYTSKSIIRLLQQNTEKVQPAIIARVVPLCRQLPLLQSQTDEPVPDALFCFEFGDKTVLPATVSNQWTLCKNTEISLLMVLEIKQNFRVRLKRMACMQVIAQSRATLALFTMK